jgi:hypothetical protein
MQAMGIRNATFLALVGGILGLTGIPTTSHADTTFDLTGAGFGAGTPPYGTVTLSQTGVNEVSVTVQLGSGEQFINGGVDSVFAFNTTVSGLTATGISFSGQLAGEAVPLGTFQTGTLSMDGAGTFGNFGYGVTTNLSGGSDPLGNKLTFTLTGTGLDISDFFANTKGIFFAADISAGCTTTNCTGNTGTGVIWAAPLPPAVLLFGTALVGMGVLGRQRRRKLLPQAA